ncbi:MAG: LptF/LptG family permease [Pseudomonadota bacterium]
MTKLQRYIFGDSLRALIIIMSGLIIMALLTQGLSQSDLILESGQSAAIYMKVVFLGSPKIFALLVPLGLFVACVWSINRIHRDSEIVVAQASGMTAWQVASPVLRLAAVVAVVQLVVNLWIQPLSQREMRDTLHNAKLDLATTLLRPGEFSDAGSSLTIYTRDNLGGVLTGLFISDQGVEPADYLATTGRVTQIDEKPVLIMQDGEIHQVEEDNSLSILKFDQYVFDLAPFAQEDSEIYYKASDRYLNELVNIDNSNHYEASNDSRFLAEAHYRLTTPLLCVAMALLAISAVLGGDYQKSGYLKRIGLMGIGALGLLFSHLVAHSLSIETVLANALQWFIPIGVIGLMVRLHFRVAASNLDTLDLATA